MITALFCVLMVIFSSIGSLAGTTITTPPLIALPRPVAAGQVHVDASFRINAAASHPYSDAVEEIREESTLRIIAAAGILLAILQNIHGRHVAKMSKAHASPPATDSKSPQPAATPPGVPPARAAPPCVSLALSKPHLRKRPKLSKEPT